MDYERLKKLLLLAMSSNQRQESATGLEMVISMLKKDGKDIYWFADRLTSGNTGGGGFFRQDSGGSASKADLDRAFQRGKAQGFDEGKLFAWAHPQKSAQKSNGADDDGLGANAWTPGTDPFVYEGADPIKGSGQKMPPQRWAAWLLTKRRSRLTEWERGFCESVALWHGEPTPRQKEVLEKVIHKAW